MGIGLKAYGRQLYDVAAVDGVTFWMKGNAPIIVQLRLAETTPTTNPPGTCTNPADCDNHFLFRFPAPGDQWTEYRVPFTALRQRPGGSVAWNPAQVLALEFWSPRGTSTSGSTTSGFTPARGAACVPTCANPALPVACPASGSRIAFCGPAGTDCANPPTLSYNTSVWGNGRDNVWIAGVSEIDDASTISHWDGSGLSTVTVASPGLWAVWGSDPDDVWTFGTGGKIRRREGGEWSEVAEPHHRGSVPGRLGKRRQRYLGRGRAGDNHSLERHELVLPRCEQHDASTCGASGGAARTTSGPSARAAPSAGGTGRSGSR